VDCHDIWHYVSGHYMIVKFYIDYSLKACHANCSLIYINGVRLILLQLYLAENIIIILL
jgi:hypothetical protein